MGANRNAEGYRDPTASLAIGRCAKQERRARLQQSQRIGYPKKHTKTKGAETKNERMGRTAGI